MKFQVCFGFSFLIYFVSGNVFAAPNSESQIKVLFQNAQAATLSSLVSTTWKLKPRLAPTNTNDVGQGIGNDLEFAGPNQLLQFTESVIRPGWTSRQVHNQES